MAENLVSSISNDLTYNLKSSSWYKIDNKLNTPSYMAEKEVQTNESEEAMKESEIREYILSHKSEVLAILGVSENGLKPHNLSATYPVSPSGSTNSVKFKFDKDMMSFSPTNTLDSSNSRKRSVSPKKILKKQSSQVSKSVDADEYLDSEMPQHKDMFHRSHSLCGNTGELSPSSRRKTFSKTGKQGRLEMTTLQRFQAKFTSKKSTSFDDSQSSTSDLNIPEIILNVPDEHSKQNGTSEAKCDQNEMKKIIFK